jgi:hypothetical protein
MPRFSKIERASSCAEVFGVLVLLTAAIGYLVALWVFM